MRWWPPSPRRARFPSACWSATRAGNAPSRPSARALSRGRRAPFSRCRRAATSSAPSASSRWRAAPARELLAMIRELLPEAAIGTDLIAGFPGEDEAAFERTLAFVEESPFSYLHVFPYSLRSGTTAARLDGRNPPATIAARARRL